MGNVREHEERRRGSSARSAASWLLRRFYVVPVFGIATRRFIEAGLGTRFYQGREFWNKSLKSWAANYLGGTLNVELRDSITAMLARQLVPGASSFLDLGCGGGTLALKLGPQVIDYCGVDISDVAIAKATENSKLQDSDRRRFQFFVSEIQLFNPPHDFDVIVFNEVLYYLSLNEVEKVIRHFKTFLRPQGVICISLKDHEISKLVQSLIEKQLRFLGGVLYQPLPHKPRWKTARNAAAPAFLVQAFGPRNKNS
jgi:SAM-dependent methyltransferase